MSFIQGQGNFPMVETAVFVGLAVLIGMLVFR